MNTWLALGSDFALLFGIPPVNAQVKRFTQAPLITGEVSLTWCSLNDLSSGRTHLFEPVASDPVVSRLTSALADDATRLH